MTASDKRPSNDHPVSNQRTTTDRPVTDDPVLRLEIKICEGCGAIWLRPVHSTATLCRPCAERLPNPPCGQPSPSTSKPFRKRKGDRA